MLGRDGEDPRFLQAKEAQGSVLERFVGKSKYPNHGQRVVAGQRLMQATSDIFLGWQRVTGLDGQPRPSRSSDAIMLTSDETGVARRRPKNMVWVPGATF
jgi:hypothetical protein